MSTPLSPRMRVVIDNNYSGDPDGLLQLLHHALSPSVGIRVRLMVSDLYAKLAALR